MNPILKSKFQHIGLLFLFLFIMIGINPILRFTPLQGLESSTNTPHAPIFLNGNNDVDNFCAGNGTDGLSWATAYVIKFYDVDASNTGSCIEINSTDRYIIIQNCSLINSGLASQDSGILLNMTLFIRIVNCTFENNVNGIFAWGCGGIIVTQNRFLNNKNAIYFYDSMECRAEKNYMVSNDFGIYGYAVDHSIFSENYIVDNNNKGICFMGYSDYNSIYCNIIMNSTVSSIYLAFSTEFDIYCNYLNDSFQMLYVGGCTNINITRNNITYGQNGIRIDSNTQNAKVRHNIISNQDDYGININNSLATLNLIFENVLSNNGIANVLDSGTSNSWYYQTAGNYYDDYSTIYPGAVDQGGYWSIIYDIPGSAGSKDLYPLVNPPIIGYCSECLPDTDDDLNGIPGYVLWITLISTMVGIFVVSKRVKIIKNL